MLKKLLLDANLLIAAFDEKGTTSAEEKALAKNQLKQALEAPDTALALTPLIRHEVLRGVTWEDSERAEVLKAAIDQFEEFDIDRETAELAADLYRYHRHQLEQTGMGRNIDKRTFDVFHFAVAKRQQLDFLSRDEDKTWLNRLYRNFLDARSNSGHSR